MEFVKYPSIDQFRHVVRNVCHSASYQGQDDNGEAIIDSTVEKPVLTFTGTVKLHGTNAGITYNAKTGEIAAQSRTRIITPEKDNAGFAFFVESLKSDLTEILKQVAYDYRHPQAEIITIFGEWCGGNIQKGVALNELEKMFVVFDVKVDGNWLDLSVLDSVQLPPGVKRIDDYPMYSMDIDFNNPDDVVNRLTEITEDVEAECPFGKAFGVSGIGEGVVWKGTYKDCTHRFKVKGEKHSSSKVKKLAKVDPEKLESVAKFIDYAVTDNRLNQGIEQVFTTNGLEPVDKGIGDFIKWVKEDVIKEEIDTLAASNLEPKDIIKPLSAKAVQWFKAKYF